MHSVRRVFGIHQPKYNPLTWDLPGGCSDIKQYSIFTHIDISSHELPRDGGNRHKSTKTHILQQFTSLMSSQYSHRNRLITSGPNVDIPPLSSLTDYIFNSAHHYPDKTALIDYDTKESIRFDQLQEEIDYLSSNLLHRGIGHGDVITYFGTNRVELIQLLCAANRIGVLVSLANGQLTTGELSMQLRLSRTKMLVTTPECAKVANSTTASLGIDPPFVVGRAEGCVPFSCLQDRARGHLSNAVRTSNSDVALLPFSSGTTGMPKGVKLSNGNLIAELHGLRHPSYLPLVESTDMSICALPMVHIAGLVIGCLNALAQGATTVILSKFSPSAFLAAIQTYKGTFTLIAPPIMTMLAKDPIASNYDLSSVTTLYSGAAPLDKTLTEMVADRLQMDCIRQGYGMTETSPATHTSPLEGWKFGSVGVPLPNTKCKVVSVESSTELGPYDEGELWVWGPQVMLGYHDNEEATSNTFSSDGWFKTGDVGYFDTDGHYFICDRLKDVIKYKGYQIAPAYLESVLLSHPDVQDTAVVGVIGEDREEVPKAWVVVKGTGSSAKEDEIRIFVNERVAPYRRLRGGVRIVQEIPKSASGKILKRTIRDIETNEKTTTKTTKRSPVLS